MVNLRKFYRIIKHVTTLLINVDMLNSGITNKIAKMHFHRTDRQSNIRLDSSSHVDITQINICFTTN